MRVVLVNTHGCTLYVRVRMYNVRMGLYVQCTYMSVRISYVNELDTVNTVNDIFFEKNG